MNVFNYLRLRDRLIAARDGEGPEDPPKGGLFDYQDSCRCVAHFCASLANHRTPLSGKNVDYSGQVADIAEFLEIDVNRAVVLYGGGTPITLPVYLARYLPGGELRPLVVYEDDRFTSNVGINEAIAQLDRLAGELGIAVPDAK